MTNASQRSTSTIPVCAALFLTGRAPISWNTPLLYLPKPPKGIGANTLFTEQISVQ